MWDAIRTGAPFALLLVAFGVLIYAVVASWSGVWDVAPEDRPDPPSLRDRYRGRDGDGPIV